MRLTTYKELHRYTAAFGAGQLNLLIIIGRPGTAKTQSLRKVVSRGCWIEGSATALGIFDKLYSHRDQHVIIDDVDELYKDRATVRLLKCLCQTDPIKRVHWHSRAIAKGLPREFETTSPVCIIANEWERLNDNVGAIEDRGYLVNFDPSKNEIHAQAANGGWFDCYPIIAWARDHLDLLPTDLSFRDYVKAKELLTAGLTAPPILFQDRPGVSSRNLQILIHAWQRLAAEYTSGPNPTKAVARAVHYQRDWANWRWRLFGIARANVWLSFTELDKIKPPPSLTQLVEGLTDGILFCIRTNAGDRAEHSRATRESAGQLAKSFASAYRANRARNDTRDTR